MTRAELIEGLEAAATGGDVLARLWEAIEGTGPHPTPDELASDWWSELPDRTQLEASERFRKLSGGVVSANLPEPSEPPGYGGALFTWWEWLWSGQPGKWASPDVAAHVLTQAWLAIWSADPEGCPAHPLAPIVRAWKERPRPAAPYPITRRASLPSFERDGAHLPDYTPVGLEASPQLSLPGFEPVAEGIPHWLLEAFRRTGGAIAQGGRLPMSLSLWFGAMVRLPIARRNGQWRILTFPHRIEHEDPKRFGRDVAAVERWLWPDGWTNRNRVSQAGKITEGLHGLRDLAYMPIPGLGSVAVIFPSVIPDQRTDPLVEFTLRIPEAAANGARIDWPTFARYAAKGATVPRAYLSAMVHLHRSAHKGHPITRRIAAPILNANDEPIRRKGGAIVRSKTDRVANPQARFVPTVTDVDLARMVGYDPRNLTRYARMQGRRAFEALAKDGHIELVPDGKGFRIFGPKRGV